MGFINLADKTVSAKLVYYGVGVGGKTTSLQAIHRIMCPRDEVKLVSIKTEEDSTLLFDFLPINLGQVEGFKIRIQGFTVPGQPKYRLMRKYVLSGADAVVFVVDSQTSRLEENLQSLDSLKTNLRLNGLDPNKIPIVLQYNKRDLDDILPEEELDRLFKFRGDLQSFPSVATEGQGVFETFVHAAGLLVEAKVQLYGLGKGSVDPRLVAEGTRRRLWETFDLTRGSGIRKGHSVAVTVPETGRATTESKTGTHGKPPAEPAPDAPVLTDDELAVDLDLKRVHAADREDADGRLDLDETLLDRAVQSNLALVQDFGKLDRERALHEQKNRELVKIAQNTVHDLNRPLSVIKLTLSSITKGLLGDVPKKMRAAVDNGLMAVRHMERLVQDLLDSSRLDFDGVKLSFQEIDMTLLVGEVVNNLRQEIAETDAVICVEPLPVVAADEWALTKVFMNLIGNALQYRHKDRRPRVIVSAAGEDDRWVFSVTDNGIGIPEGDRARLFQRFERGSNTQGITGTGLGLHIVREIALGHGGDAWVESTEGEGTQFYLALPHEPALAPHSPLTDVAAFADR
jgi:hypothetical protein